MKTCNSHIHSSYSTIIFYSRVYNLLKKKYYNMVKLNKIGINFDFNIIIYLLNIVFCIYIYLI